jgi:hypothetical protein
MLNLMGELLLIIVTNVPKIVGFLKSILNMFKDLTVVTRRFLTDSTFFKNCFRLISHLATGGIRIPTEAWFDVCVFSVCDFV